MVIRKAIVVMVVRVVRVVVYKRRCGREDGMPDGDDRDGGKKSNGCDGGRGKSGCPCAKW